MADGVRDVIAAVGVRKRIVAAAAAVAGAVVVVVAVAGGGLPKWERNGVAAEAAIGRVGVGMAETRPPMLLRVGDAARLPGKQLELVHSSRWCHVCRSSKLLNYRNLFKLEQYPLKHPKWCINGRVWRKMKL